MSSRIKIDPPNALPSTGITSIQYKQWKIALKIFLQQTADFREFYPGGKYPSWEALEDDPNRIKKLSSDDKTAIAADNTEQLAQRRINLETFLGIIARYSDEGDFDDIMEKSTSLEWIHQLHERRYGIQRKGRFFHRLNSVRFDKATMSDYFKFYTDIRSCFRSNLLKTGDPVNYKKTTMTEDEKVSPTTECLLISIALERIDFRLPDEIDRIFGHRMNDGTTLIDLQTEIFSYIPRALASLERDEMMCNAYMIHNIQKPAEEREETSVDINAFSYNKPRFQGRQQNSQQGKYSNSCYNKTQTKKFCKICEALEMPTYIINSHNPTECRKKSTLQQIAIDEANCGYDEKYNNSISEKLYSDEKCNSSISEKPSSDD